MREEAMLGHVGAVTARDRVQRRGAAKPGEAEAATVVGEQLVGDLLGPSLALDSRLIAGPPGLERPGKVLVDVYGELRHGFGALGAVGEELDQGQSSVETHRDHGAETIALAGHRGLFDGQIRPHHQDLDLSQVRRDAPTDLQTLTARDLPSDTVELETTGPVALRYPMVQTTLDHGAAASAGAELMLLVEA